MKRLLLSAVVAASLCLGCTTSVQIRDEEVRCIGLIEEGDPAYKWRVSGWNVAVGIAFVAMILPPVLVVTDYGRCPTGVNDQKGIPEG